ncbi:MAG: Ig-like domain-containing protein [Acidobacteriia bacterium]|nr:Ig-like domain-containing protein [Terriglobia bacterium]
MEATDHAQQPLLQITSPVEGTVVRPGQSITVTLAADPSVQNMAVWGDAALSFGESTPSPLRFTVSVAPDALPGKHLITAAGTASGVDVDADSVSVDVERPDAPQFLTVELAILKFSGVGDDAPIITYGLFNDGNKINISRSTKTTYLSNDPTVATVSNEGLVTAVAPGKTTIAVNTTDCAAPPFLIRVEVPYPQPIGTSRTPPAGPVETMEGRISVRMR